VGSKVVVGVIAFYEKVIKVTADVAAFLMCAEHVRQLGGASPLSSLVEVKD